MNTMTAVRYLVRGISVAQFCEHRACSYLSVTLVVRDRIEEDEIGLKNRHGHRLVVQDVDGYHHPSVRNIETVQV